MSHVFIDKSVVRKTRFLWFQNHDSSGNQTRNVRLEVLLQGCEEDRLVISHKEKLIIGKSLLQFFPRTEGAFRMRFETSLRCSWDHSDLRDWEPTHTDYKEGFFFFFGYLRGNVEKKMELLSNISLVDGGESEDEEKHRPCEISKSEAAVPRMATRGCRGGDRPFLMYSLCCGWDANSRSCDVCACAHMYACKAFSLYGC